MKTPNIGSIVFAPEGDVPLDPVELQRYLRNIILQLQIALSALTAGHLDKQTVAPTKPRDGDIRYADGTLWNPGSGQGLYQYRLPAATWVFVG